MNIIFDMDGTLYKTDASLEYAIKDFLKEFSIQIDPQIDIYRQINIYYEGFLKSILPQGADFELLRERFRYHEYKSVAEYGQLYPGVKDALKRLKAMGHRLCLCSNGSEKYIELVLNTTGIFDCFDKITSAKNYESKTEAVKAIVSQNEKSIMIGDSIHDIKAANENNIPSIAAVYGYGSYEDIADATFKAQSIDEVMSLITGYYKQV